MVHFDKVISKPTTGATTSTATKSTTASSLYPRNDMIAINSTKKMHQQNNNPQIVPTSTTSVIQNDTTIKPSYVYIRDKEHIWIPVIQIGRNGNMAKVVQKIQREKDSTTTTTNDVCPSTPPLKEEEEIILEVDVSKYPYQSLPLQNLNEQNTTSNELGLRIVDDMIDLTYLHEAAILYNLKERYELLHKPYTRAGEVLVSINPYLWIRGLYSEETRNIYTQVIQMRSLSTTSSTTTTTTTTTSIKKELPPHIYEASTLAFLELIKERKSQSILVSGESGAGKTTTVKILMSHLATIESTIHSSMEIQDSNGYNPLEGIISWWEDTFHCKNDYMDIPAFEYDVSATLPDTNDNVVVQRVLDSNPLLEAFGNAKTARCDNSSRFGKYTKLLYNTNSDGTLVGSICETFLLEKSRVICHNSEMERSFHIFYQLLSAPKDQKVQIWEDLVSLDSSSFRYLGNTAITAGLDDDHRSRSNTTTSTKKEQQHEDTNNSTTKDATKQSSHEKEGGVVITDEQKWIKTLTSLEFIGIKEDTLGMLMKALCIVLQLGNITFIMDSTDKDDDGCSIVDDSEFDKLLSLLLGFTPSKTDDDDDGRIKQQKQEVQQAFTTRTISISDNKESYTVPLKVQEAQDVCDAFAKEVYSLLFTWLVRHINTSMNIRNDDCSFEKVEKKNSSTVESDTTLSPTTVTDTTTVIDTGTNSDNNADIGFIGLLDIFGFEIFDTNHFEQLCINHANEKLQEKFIKDVFQSVKIEYTNEGILDDFSNKNQKIKYDDNTYVLDLFEGKGSGTGLIRLLNEECIRPNGNDFGFVNKLYAYNKGTTTNGVLLDNRKYQKFEFGIKHYAGNVKYNAYQIVNKNKDTLSINVITIGMNCQNTIISQEFQNKQQQQQQKQKQKTSIRKCNKMKGLSTVYSQFQIQLNNLLQTISKTKTRYIRCINPNETKTPNILNTHYCMNQLRSSGLVSAIMTTRITFPNKLKYDVIFQRFRVLAGDTYWNSRSCVSTALDCSRDERDTEKDDVNCLLDSIFNGITCEQKSQFDLLLLCGVGGGSSNDGSSSDDVSLPPNNNNKQNITTSTNNYYILGKTLVYFRPGVLEYLETELLAIFDKCALKIQTWYKKRKLIRRLLHSTNKKDRMSFSLDIWLEDNKTQFSQVIVGIFKIFVKKQNDKKEKSSNAIPKHIQATTTSSSTSTRVGTTALPRKKSKWGIVKDKMDKKGQKVSKWKTTFVFNKKK